MGRWDEQVSDADVASTLLRFLHNGRGDVFYGSEARMARVCSLGPGVYRSKAQLQLRHVQTSFHMLLAYEERAGVRFDWVVRLRTDMLLLGPLPHYTTLAEGTHLVPGQVRSEVNDHTAIASRAHADAYFDLADELRCQPNSTTKPTSTLQDDQLLIASRLKAQATPIWMVRLWYVLVRPGALPETHWHDCGRIIDPPGERPEDAIAVSWNASRPWYPISEARQALHPTSAARDAGLPRAAISPAHWDYFLKCCRSFDHVGFACDKHRNQTNRNDPPASRS